MPKDQEGNSRNDDWQISNATHHAESLVLPDTKLSCVIDPVIRKAGEIISWCWIILLLIIIANVGFRHLLGQGRVEFEEIQWHIYSVGFLAGLSYCLISDDHVRIDFIHENLSFRTKAWIEFLGTVLLLAPFIVVVIYYAIPFVTYSWKLGEVSDAPGGLPFRWMIKSALILGFFLLGLSALSRVTRLLKYLFNAKSEGKVVPVGDTQDGI